jgi:hypothetical protein
MDDSDGHALLRRLAVRGGWAGEPTLTEVVEAVRAIPYGRPAERTPNGVLAQGRGTCSTKHALLGAILAAHWPETEPRLVHRVYRVDRRLAGERFGERAEAAIPAEGLLDVHRYLTAVVGGRRIAIDATFPGPPWDGRSPMPLACGPGDDHPAGADPDADKRALERRHCDPAIREPFIAALAAG